MPELPDVTVYVEALTRHVVGRRLARVRLGSVFLLRSVEPPLAATHGLCVVGAERIGKRIVLALEEELFLVLHLMIAGRLRWSPKVGAKLPGRYALAAFDFEHGTLLLTEASTKKRAHLHAVRGRAALAEHDPHGLEVLECDFEAFAARLAHENHTLKRALTDPSILSGIGNAYSDEALHAARLSPFIRTHELTEPDARRLFDALRATLTRFTQALRTEVGDGFPDIVTAFRPDMAVHGRHNQPCPACGAAVQRIAFASREFNYCATCQTGGKLLKDRALSQLLKDDWPRTPEELEAKKRAARDQPKGWSRAALVTPAGSLRPLPSTQINAFVTSYLSAFRAGDVVHVPSVRRTTSSGSLHVASRELPARGSLACRREERSRSALERCV